MPFTTKTFIFIALVALYFVCPNPSKAQIDTFETRSVLSATFEKISDTKAQITLSLQAGWHINANQVTMDFLVPTEVMGAKAAIEYPKGKMIDTPLGQLAVYEDQTIISITLSPDDAELKLKAQACDGSTCYPPSEWIFNTK